MPPSIQETDRLEFKKVLALVRNGDYAHPGSEDAIRLVFEKISKDSTKKMLDVGCGLGATAYFLQQQGYGNVTGIDLIQDLIEYAQNKYSECTFVHTNVCQIAETLNTVFDLFYHFNSFYAFPDHENALKALRSIAREFSEIIIFDYVDLGSFNDHRPPDEFDVIYNPIQLSDAHTLFAKSGWELTEHIDITEQYKKWYTDLIANIKAKREAIIAISSEKVFDFAVANYSYILQGLEEGHLGGGIFYGKAI